MLTSTRINATDFSMYYLMFGRKPRLLIDILFGMNTADLKGNTSTKYVENLKQKWNGHTRLQTKLLGRNRGGVNDIMIIMSDVHY